MSTKEVIMKQILIVLIFMACALIESPEDYAWMDSERSAETVAEYNSEHAFDSHDETGFRHKVEHDHPADNLNDHETMVYTF